MGSFFSIGVTNRRFAPSNTFLAIRLLVGDVFPPDVKLLPSPLYVDLLMDLLCVSEADSTFKAYYAGFIRLKRFIKRQGTFLSLNNINIYNHCILVNLQQDYLTYMFNA
jgi:hypothetical protein